MICILLSDHLYDWSERLEFNQPFVGKAAEATSCATALCTSVKGTPARFTNQALQALRETWVQMRRWTRAWSKALPLCKHRWSTPCDGIRSARLSGPRGRISEESPIGTPDHQRNLRNQSGASASQGEARLTRHANNCPYRYRTCGNAYGQHASEFPRSKSA